MTFIKKNLFFKKALANVGAFLICFYDIMGKTTRLTTEQFIERARAVHGDKYDYSKVNYVNSKTKVTIICPKHGEFKQSPYRHAQGDGCPYCAGSVKGTTESFIEKARKIHGDKYDYSKVDYKDNRTKVTIICPVHGEFEQEPANHLHNHGCPYCAKKHKWTTEEFIERARKVHGYKYDYSKSKYVDSSTKICVICPEHGEFWQLPYSHLNGYGCKKCIAEDLHKRYTFDTEMFINKAKKVHGDKYIYDKTIYVNAHEKVIIICPEHGEFEQKAYMHLQGYGCPSCNQSHLENSIEQFLTEKGINFTKRAHFPWLGSQHLDFYLTDYNVAIECQGRQHFVPVEFFGGEDGLKSTMERDERKSKLCNDKGVELLYFTYYEGIKEEGNIYKNKDKLLEKIMSTKCL